MSERREVYQVGVMQCPENFRYRSVLERGRPVHNGDYFSLRHPKMACSKRAKLFAPFAALSGFDEKIHAEEEALTPRRFPDPEEQEELNEKLRRLAELTAQTRMQKQSPMKAEACFFVSLETNHEFQELGVYETMRGIVTAVCPEEQQLILEGRVIRFADLCRLEIL
ncbi:MAG: hypothetical protein ACI4WR_09920 [Bulleidia sp.]